MMHDAAVSGDDNALTIHFPLRAALIPDRRLALQAHGADGTTHWVSSHSVVYVVAAHQYTDIYCRDRLIHLRASFSDVIKQLSVCVVRVHRSYAVNPLYISHLKGVKLHLTNGVQVPIPIKQRRRIRMELSEYFVQLGDRG